MGTKVYNFEISISMRRKGEDIFEKLRETLVIFSGNFGEFSGNCKEILAQFKKKVVQIKKILS